MPQKTRRFFSLLLVAAICLTTLQLTTFADDTAEKAVAATAEDVMAGLASPEELYPDIDPATVPDILGADTAVERGHIKRLYEDEGENLNQVIFLNADGTKTLYLYDHPVKFADASGKINDISLCLAGGKVNGEYKTQAGASDVTFSRLLSDGIRLQGNGESISLTPKLPGENGMLPVVSAAAQKLSEKSVAYTYDAKTSIEYSLTYTGFKEDIVVSEYTGQTEYDFTLRTGGLKLVEKNGSYVLTDGDGNIKATLGDIIVFTADERNNTMGRLSAKTVTECEEYTVTIILDADYLADEKTAYPIRIDPTVEITYENNGAGAIQDITLNSLTDSDGASWSLTVGKRATYGTSRVLMKFPGLDFSSLGSDIDVLSASVELRDLMCEGTEMEMSCHPFTGNVWNEVDSEWANVSPNSYGAAMSTNVISFNNGYALPTHFRYSFDITAAVQGWKYGSYDQSKGIIFMASSAVENGSTYNSRTFASYNRAEYRPSFSMTYENSSFGSDENFANATTITLGLTYNVNITNSGDLRYFKFTPSSDGFYSFESTTAVDNTAVWLFNSQKETIELTYSQLPSKNFQMVYHLVGGVTYYFAPGFAGGEIGTYKVSIKSATDSPCSSINMASVSFGNTYNVTEKHAYKPTYYTFMPTQSGEYVFYTSRINGDPKIWIYNSALTCIGSDNNGAGDYNSRVVATLSAGNTYYIVAGHNGSSSGQYKINMLKSADVIAATYVIGNISSGKYVDIDGPGAQQWVHQWKLHTDLQDRWYIQKQSDGYYTIRSEYGNKYYVGISAITAGINNIKLYSSIADNTKWKIYVNAEGNYIFESKSATGKVLYSPASSQGTKLQLSHLYALDGNGKDEWKLIRVLPTSGYEVQYNPDIWNNDNNICIKTNCYGYALNTQYDPTSSSLIRVPKRINPGFASGHYYLPDQISAALIDLCVKDDAVALGITFRKVAKTVQCSAGTYKVAVFVAPGSDYHFYRQNPDGTWSHKSGISPVTNVDASGEIIIDPEFADRNYYDSINNEYINYSVLVGFYEVTPINLINESLANSATANLDTEQIQFTEENDAWPSCFHKSYVEDENCAETSQCI